MPSPACTRFFILSNKVKSLLPSFVWTIANRCDNLSMRSSPQASDTKRQIVMDDKIFESARMTAALDDDRGAYEAIPAVNIFDAGLDAPRPTNAIAMTARRRRHIGRWWILAPVLAGGTWLLLGLY